MTERSTHEAAPRGKPVIALIGAAGLTFGVKVLRDLVNHPELEGSTFRMMDIHEEHLAIMTRVARLLLARVGRDITIESTPDRRAALQGADYVLVSVDTDRWGTWQQDFSLPRQLGSRQIYGELGGPGGLFHSLRQIPVHLEIGRDIEAICPKAMVLIESNPLNRICLALRRHTGVGQVVGLCHGVEIIAHAVMPSILDVPGEEITVVAAGTNHFTWILELRRRSTGEDLYPRLRAKLGGRDPSAAPLSQKMLEVFGYYPSPGDTHIGEYLPYAWELVQMEEGFLDRWGEDAERRWRYLEEYSRGAGSGGYPKQQAVEQEELRLKEFTTPREWTDTLAFPIFSACHSGRERVMAAINLVNEGQISNLPTGVFVETPAIADSSGLRAVTIGALPGPLAAMCRRDVDQMELTVEAAVSGDRRVALQAMLMDPVVDSVATAERILEEMLRANSAYLPQFG